MTNPYLKRFLDLSNQISIMFDEGGSDDRLIGSWQLYLLLVNHSQPLSKEALAALAELVAYPDTV